MLPRGLTMATQQSSMATQQSSVDAQQSSVAARRPNPPNFFLQRFKECDPIDRHDITRVPVTSSHPNVKTPSHMWTFSGEDDDIRWMIRQEYHNTLHAILKWIKRANRCVVIFYSAWLNELIRSFWSYPRGSKTIPFTATNALEGDAQEYPNPFKDYGNISIDAGMVIIGLPGIGEWQPSFWVHSLIHLQGNRTFFAMFG